MGVPELTMLIKCLSHYCDMLWEYDCLNGKIFIHYDLIAKEYENSSYTVNELIRLFKNEFHICVNELIRDKYLNEKYLKSFFEENKSYEEFEIQFATDNSGLIWYCVRVERIADVIIVSGKNMYNEFKERSIYNSVKGSFENVISIDVRIGTCVVVHSKRTLSHPAKTYDYNNTMKMFVDKYTAEDDRECLKNELSLDYVVKRLEEENEYNIYVNVISASGKKSCKKVTFSYTDKSKSFITFSTVNMDEIVTRYERMLNDLKRKSRNDMLTGVYNRNFYEANIKNQSFTGGVAIFDIDNFKLCNDTKGHGAGDELLVRVSQIIKSEITDDDKLIRYGGDEFLLLIPGASSSALEKTLNRIQKSVRNSNLNETDGFTLSLSVGGVIAKNETLQEAAYRADRLMYRAKSKKNAVVTEQNQFAYNGGECYGSAQKILIADDWELNRKVLCDMIGNDFEILEARDGRECMELIGEYGTGISLILLDDIMPGTDGFEILAEMNRLHYIDDIPVIMITSNGTDNNIRRAFSLGVSDYISRPFDPKVVTQRIQNTLRLHLKQQRLTSIITKQLGESQNSERIMTEVLSGILGRKNGESAAHIRHIRKVTAMLLERLILKTDKYGLSWHDCEIIADASVLHDIGKIEIDSKILNKPGRLTPKEREELKDTLNQGIKNALNSERYKNFLNIMSRCHNYSFTNSLLISLQNKNATLVKSFTDWKKDGVKINKNEKGIKIFCPVKQVFVEYQMDDKGRVALDESITSY